MSTWLKSDLKSEATLPHTWEQTWETVTIVVPVVCNEKGKVNIHLTPSSVKIQTPLGVFHGATLYHIYPDESVWYYQGDTLFVELAKANPKIWWSEVIQGVEEKKIEPQHPYPN